MDTQLGYPIPGHLTRNPSSRRGASHIGSQGEEAISVTHDTYIFGFLWWNPVSILMSFLSFNCLVHSNGTSKLPPGRILTDRAKTSGIPDVMSGSSITVDPLDLIIFLVPSQVHIMPTKFVDVKSVPKMTGRCICLQTMKDWVNHWLLIVKVHVT